MLNNQNHTNSTGWLVVLAMAAALLLSGCLAAETDPEMTELLCEDGSKGCWSVVQAEILDGTGSCTNCHTGAGAGPSNLSWDADQYQHVVVDGLESGQGGGLIVDQNSSTPSDSFLYRKVIGDLPADSSLGSKMPIGGNLTQGDIDIIADWLTKGAPEF